MRIALVVPYFGRFPGNFQTVLNSCEYNRDLVDWIFFTDDKRKFVFPSNCHVFYCSFNDIKRRIQQLYDFEICLDNPYKLCDYKPSYGHIFSEELQGYDFWGHCDIDCIFGKLSTFLEDRILEYDRILRLGHLCLYKNKDSVNKRYMLPIDGKYRYKEVFQSNKNCIFDENNVSNNVCIDTIWEHYKFSRLYCDNIIANIYYKTNRFVILFQVKGAQYQKRYHENMQFYWSDGHVYLLRVDKKELIKKEFAYIHFMKRRMIFVGNEKYRCLKIVPNKFIAVKKIPETIEEFENERKLYLSNQFFVSRLNNIKIKFKNFFSSSKKGSK